MWMRKEEVLVVGNNMEHDERLRSGLYYGQDLRVVGDGGRQRQRTW